MRRLLPDPTDPIEPAEVYADIPVAEGRPSVRLNMIVSVDGATAFRGVSGALGGPADKHVFAVLRTFPDVVLVAAGTMRAEHYGPAVLPADAQAARRARGQTAVPPIAVVSRTCQLEWDTPFFTAATERPVIITVSDASSADRARAAEVADVIVAGDHDVDLGRAVAELGGRGAQHVLAEGGPTLNGLLASASVLDELCLTLSPNLASGDAKRILAGATLDDLARLRLRSVCEEDDYLFLRYRPTLP